jgi:hypothetical protein
MAITEVARSSLAVREFELVVAATPTGPLAHAIDAYRQAVAVRIGRNPAHDLPPHCLVVRSYHDRPSSVRAYRRAFAATLMNNWRRPENVVVTALSLHTTWHGLEIESQPLRALAANLASPSVGGTRPNHFTPHDRLRLALAAGFDHADHEALSELALRIVDPMLPAQWDVALWLRTEGAWAPIWTARAS